MQSPIKFVSMDGLKVQIERAVHELTGVLSQRLESRLLDWQNTELQPLLEERLAAKKMELEAIAGEFIQQADEIRFQLAGMNSLALANNVEETDLGMRRVSALERVLSAAGGFLVGGVGSAGIGAAFGYQEMLKSLLPQMGLAIVTIILAGFNPLVMIPVMVSGGVVQGLLSIKGTNATVKQKIAEKFAQEIRTAAFARGDELATAVDTQLEKIQMTFDEGFDHEIESIRGQVQSVLREKQQGQVGVDAKIAQLEGLNASVNDLDLELNQLIQELAL